MVGNRVGLDAIVADLGMVEYRTAWSIQRRVAEAVRERRILPTLLLVEHPPVFTIGRNGNLANVRAEEATFRQIGAEVIRVDRGGDITFHGPGQLVGYPIFDLAQWRLGAADYVHRLEDVIIVTLARFGIHGERVRGRVGVWVGGAKVAAIGVRVSRGVSSHGFALNIMTDLRYFEYIVPCGIADAPVTSLSALRGDAVSPPEVARVVKEEVGNAFGLNVMDLPAPDLLAQIGSGADGRYD